MTVKAILEHFGTFGLIVAPRHVTIETYIFINTINIIINKLNRGGDLVLNKAHVLFCLFLSSCDK